MPRAEFVARVEQWRKSYKVLGPVTRHGQPVFAELGAAVELDLDYGQTMTSPGKLFLYQSRQPLFSCNLRDLCISAVEPAAEAAIICAIRPCDLHAILYLDHPFCHDPYYQARRRSTLLIALNCQRPASPFCFCASVGTGPHLAARSGYDLLLTDLGEELLIEEINPKLPALLQFEGRPAAPADWQAKAEQEQAARAAITKEIEMAGLNELFLGNLNHPVWARTADLLCLSCTNCVMVCPTCFCHDVVDTVEMGLARAGRHRQWDACQDRQFAAVAGANFRGSRAARLRQFVTHKLDYTSQYGMAGTVGCGRCIQWCPTGIDLVEIANEIRRNPGAKSAAA